MSVELFGVLERMGKLVLKDKCPFRLTESGHKIFYNFKSITYLQTRMVDEGYLDEIY